MKETNEALEAFSGDNKPSGQDHLGRFLQEVASELGEVAGCRVSQHRTKVRVHHPAPDQIQVQSILRTMRAFQGRSLGRQAGSLWTSIPVPHGFPRCFLLSLSEVQ